MSAWLSVAAGVTPVLLVVGIALLSRPARATVALARTSLLCWARSRGVMIILLATIVPMVLLPTLLSVVPQQMLEASATLVATVRGESPEEAKAVMANLAGEDLRSTLLDMSTTGAVRLIGVVGTLIAVLFVALTNEAARRSTAHILAHPVRRSNVVAGSFLGSALVAVLSVHAMSILALLVGVVQEHALNWGLMVSALWLDCGVIVTTAYAVLLTTVWHTVPAVLATLGLSWVCSKTTLVHIVVQQSAGGAVQRLAGVWLVAIPRLGDFADAALYHATRIHGTTLQDMTVTDLRPAVALGALHVLLALGLASHLLGRKEL